MPVASRLVDAVLMTRWLPSDLKTISRLLKAADVSHAHAQDRNPNSCRTVKSRTFHRMNIFCEAFISIFQLYFDVAFGGVESQLETREKSHAKYEESKKFYKQQIASVFQLTLLQ